MNNIPGVTGTAKYNPTTKKLTFTNVTDITGYHTIDGSKKCAVYTTDDITVDGSISYSNTAVNAGVYSEGNITLDGNVNMKVGGASDMGCIHSEKILSRLIKRAVVMYMFILRTEQ